MNTNSRIARFAGMALLGAVLLAAPLANAQEIGGRRNFGVGLILGQPTGLDLKLYLSPGTALEVAVGAGYLGGTALHAHLDFKFTLGTIANKPSFNLPFYLGFGGKVISWFDDHHHKYYFADEESGKLGLGVRVPFGIAFELKRAPVDIFLELAPGIAFLPGVGGFLDGALGVRYWF